jgi:hypothetical protein
MSKNRMINTKFWSDGWIINLEPLERYLFLYLLTNEHTNICGIYELPLKIIERESGLDQKTILSIFEKISDKILYFEDWIYIKNFLKHQKASGNVKLGMEAGIKEVPSSIMALIKAKMDTPPLVPQHTPDTAYNLNSNLNLNLNHHHHGDGLLENNLQKNQESLMKKIQGLQNSSAYHQEFWITLSLEDRKKIDEWIADFTDPDLMRAFDIKYGVRGWMLAKIEKYGLPKFKKAHKAGLDLKKGSFYDRAKQFYNVLYS